MNFLLNQILEIFLGENGKIQRDAEFKILKRWRSVANYSMI